MPTVVKKELAYLLLLSFLGCQARESKLADRTTASAEIAVSSYDVSPNGERIVFSSASGKLFLLDIATQHVDLLTESLNLDGTPAFSPDESFVVFASAAPDHSRSHIFHFSLSERKLTQLTSGEGIYDSSPRYSRDGSTIVFSRAHRHRPSSMGGMTWDRWDLYTMDSDGSNVLRISNKEYRSLSPPHFGIDGQTVFFSSRIKRQNSSLYSAIFSVSTTNEQPPKNLTPDNQNNMGCAAVGSAPAVSPDGSKIVFISDRKTKYDYDLWIMNLDGSNPTPLNLTHVSEYNALPLFSPNGREVFFLAKSGWTAESRTLFDLWKAKTDGQHPQRVTFQAAAVVK